MDPIVIRVFASQIREDAQNPSSGQNTVVLSGVKGPNPVTPGPNDALFERAADGNIQVNLNVISDAVASAFARGKVYKITIEEDDSK